jgi:hypothetical protein
MRFDRILAGLALGAVLLLTGCNTNLLTPDPQRLAESRAVYDQFAADDIAGLQARMAPQTKVDATPDKIEALRRYLPAGKPLHVRNVGWNSFTSTGGTRVSISDEYEYANDYVLFQSTFDRPAGAAQDELIGFQVHVSTRAQIAANGFTLAGKGWGHYALLGYAILELLLILGAVIHILRNRSKGWILWLIFSLFGVGQFRFDWTTGAHDFQLLYISLLGVGMVRGVSAFSTWVLSVSFPLGAVMTLAQRGKFVRYKKQKALQRYAPLDLPPETPPDVAPLDPGPAEDSSKTEPPGS